MGRTSKRNKSYYMGGNSAYKNIKKSRTDIELNQIGFLATCNNFERDCVREAYNLLNEAANQLYGPEEFLGKPDTGSIKNVVEREVGSEMEEGHEPIKETKEEMMKVHEEIKGIKEGVKETKEEMMEIKEDNMEETMEEIKETMEERMETKEEIKESNEEKEEIKESNEEIKETKEERKEPKAEMKETKEKMKKILKELREGDEDSDDLEGDLMNDIAALQATPPSVESSNSGRPKWIKRRFYQRQSGAKNCIFIATTLDDPLKLTTMIMDDIIKCGVPKTKYLCKFMPVQMTCKANVREISESTKAILDNILPPGSSTYYIDFKARNSTDNIIKKDDLAVPLSQVFTNCNPECTPDYVNPDYVLFLNIIRTTCCISLLTKFHEYAKYNLNELVKRPVEEMPPSTEGKSSPVKDKRPPSKNKEMNKPNGDRPVPVEERENIVEYTFSFNDDEVIGLTDINKVEDKMDTGVCETIKESSIENKSDVSNDVEMLNEAVIKPEVSNETVIKSEVSNETEIKREVSNGAEIKPEISNEPEIKCEVSSDVEMKPEVSNEAEIKSEDSNVELVEIKPAVSNETVTKSEVSNESENKPEVSNGTADKSEVSNESENKPEGSNEIIKS